jgi:predicted ABC-type ATPase
MILNVEEQQLADEARVYIKEHRQEIIAKVVVGAESVDTPVSIFMAGSPGAGKTEFSQNLLKRLGGNIVRIDADDVRDMLPQYQGANAYVVQGAAALGVEKVYDFVLKHKLHALLDGTFQKYEKAMSNIERSLHAKRAIEVFYVFQDPLVAWEFTRKREAVEGRNIPKEAFIAALFAANENVKKMKVACGQAVALHMVLKNITNENEEIYYNVDEVDKYVKIGYTVDELKARL